MAMEPGRIDQQGLKPLQDAVAGFLERLRYLDKTSPHRGAFNDLWGAARQLEAALNAERGTPRPVPRQPYESSRKKSHSGATRPDEIEETHESYGVIHISRVSGSSRRLFGSSVRHGHFFTMKVSRAKRVAGEFGEHFYDTTQICEVHMTAAQFVDAITTMNQGEGIPCTILRVEGVLMDDVPDDAGSELRIIAEGAKEEFEAIAEGFVKAEAELDDLLAKKSLTKDDKQRVKEAVYRARRYFKESAPFAAQMLTEMTEKVVVKGRADIESFMRLALERAGIKSIKDSGGHLILESDTEKKS